MKDRHALLLLSIALSLIVSTMSALVFAESCDVNLSETESLENANQKGQFIVAFNWSLDVGREYVWPFESMRPAPYDSVWMVIETMPRFWPEKNPGKRSISIPAYRLLRVNGRTLPRLHRIAGSEEFRIPLDRGRLRLSFSLPSGFKLDPQYAMIRVRLHKVGY